jgi:membrane-associated phospholipid phosphatase
MVRAVVGTVLPGILAISALLGATPYTVDTTTDLTLTLGMLGVVGVEEAFAKPALAGGRACPVVAGGDYCDKAKLNALDRTVVGNDSAAWRTVSDVGQTSAIVGPIVATSLDAWLSESSSPVADAATETLVIAEAVAAATLMSGILKLAVRRPRPVQYSPGRSVASIEQQVSFPSGHTTATAAATTAYATTFWLKHSESASRYLVVAGAVLWTGVTGYGRIGGGKHFCSDVLAGAMLGGVTGFLVPTWHRGDRTPALAFELLPGGAAVSFRVEL